MLKSIKGFVANLFEENETLMQKKNRYIQKIKKLI
jgi:hypothetical protein